MSTNSQRGPDSSHSCSVAWGVRFRSLVCKCFGDRSADCDIIQGQANEISEWVGNLPRGPVCQMTPKGAMNTTAFINCGHYFFKYKVTGPCLIIFDGAMSHIDYGILGTVLRFDIILLRAAFLSKRHINSNTWPDLCLV
jgi:hypothetical protein